MLLYVFFHVSDSDHFSLLLVAPESTSEVVFTWKSAIFTCFVGGACVWCFSQSDSKSVAELWLSCLASEVFQR